MELFRMVELLLLLICALSNIAVEGRLKRGRYEHLEAFCNGPDIYVSVPWDCTGYVHCMNIGSQRKAYWIECPANLYYSFETKTCTWPKNMNSPCPPLKDTIQTYCRDHPTARFQSPDHCAQYYDCSDRSFNPGLGPYLKECPFPQLYHTSLKMCTDQSTVKCTDRFTPVTKCDYAQHAGADCSVQTTPGCEGQLNGDNPYPGRLLTEYYLVCQGNMTVDTRTCPDGKLFDPVKMMCTTDLDPVAIEIFCAANPTETIAHPANCAQFYDCKLPFTGRLQECPYPKLFSTQSSRCEAFQQVQCRFRGEPKAPCDYHMANVAGSTMETCLATYHSCRGLPDGANPTTPAALSSSYIICLGERTMEVKACLNGQTYDPVLKRCTENVELGLVVRQCRAMPTALLPDPENCARYYNCSSSTSTPGFKKYQSECDYPLLFNTQTLACDDFTVVQCGARLEPKAPCDYQSTVTKCEGILCNLPCLERSPSCVGMPDGNNTYPGRELSSFYITCIGERTVSVGICRFGVYDPTPRMCMSEPAQESILSYCQRNPSGVIPHYSNCARYYNCSTGSVANGYLQECLYPQLFNMETMACDSYQNVQCRYRFMPTEPCEYLQNQVCPAGQPGCLPCEQRLPSCTGLEDGNNTFAGRESFYVVCLQGRTVAVRECDGTAFDPLTRSCLAKPTKPSIDEIIRNPVRYCTANPAAVFQNPLICSQYFDCRQGVTMLGKFKIECPYPQLFDVTTSGCLPYSSVDCGRRTVPIAPCEYQANLRCPDKGTCTPCRERFESCKGLPNGRNAISSRPTHYVECRDQRTMGVFPCDGGLFDAVTRQCQLQFDPRNPSLYCAANPNDLVANPDNCAQFFDCGRQNTPLGNYLRECPYLQLFSTTDLKCHLFDTVTCGLRAEPKAPCDYQQNLQCTDPAGCEPCELSKPSCVGLADGNNTFPGIDTRYIVCSSERTIGINMCAAGVYEPSLRSCVVLDNPDVVCPLRPTAKIAHPTRCAHYYDCGLQTSPLGKYIRECPYPSLYNEASGACQDFTTVDCGNKSIPIGPCDYLSNRCLGASPNCVPCEKRFVSCVGRPDGDNSFTGDEWTNKYVQCQRGRTVGDLSCSAGYFDPITRSCVTRLSAESIKRYCQMNPDLIVTNPLNCAQYFDCSPASVAANTFLRECPYPMLFSAQNSVCLNFTEVTCGSRDEPIQPCQYLQNRCNRNDKTCVPCQERFVSCIGLPDGYYPMPGNMSARYIECRSGRTIATKTCDVGMFDPTSKTCEIDVTDDSIKAYCLTNKAAVIPHRRNCSLYYDCQEAIGGSHLRECRYPQLFDVALKVCRNFTDVQCMNRYEPKAPCEYLQHQCLQGATNCLPCSERLPSCVGMQDGNNPFPGRNASQYYVQCLQDRTMAVEVCQVSLFDQTTRTCSNKIDANVLGAFCKENPTVLIPDPDSCSRYYNCSDPSVQQGLDVPHKQECKYPRLFGYGDTKCKIFAEVQCDGRYEPRAPCEYVENQCFNQTCPVCEQKFPSCVGKSDGSNIFPGKEGTEFYIVCYQTRTVAIVTCTVGSYNHRTRACEAVDKTAPLVP